MQTGGTAKLIRPGWSLSPVGAFVVLGDEWMKVKICGMKSLLTAKVAEEAGADFIGFIFWPESHRYIEPEHAAVISSQLQHSWKTGVFVDEDIEKVNEIVRQVHLDFVQLHGHENAAYARKVQCSVIKAFRYGDNFSAEAANEYPAELILIDAFCPGKVGGTGESFDWRSAAEEIAKVEKPVLIAGGINIDNLQMVLRTFHPYGVDVSGSLEVAEEKSISKIQAFMRRARSLPRGRKRQ